LNFRTEDLAKRSKQLASGHLILLFAVEPPPSSRNKTCPSA
jgi:hypothetical protein